MYVSFLSVPAEMLNTSGLSALGAVRFHSTAQEPSLWAKVQSSISEELLNELIMNTWKEHKPSAVISITGGASEFKSLMPSDKLVIERGLSAAIKTTNAWLMTGGTDSGVMKFVGRIVAKISSPRSPVVCVGIAPFDLIVAAGDMERIAPGTVFSYPASAPHDAAKSNFLLEPHHSHFLLVDSGPQGSPSADEALLRSKLERLLCPSQSGNRLAARPAG